MNEDQLRQNIKTLHQSLQASNPLIHCLTNYVASPLVANTLLACSASPAMVDHPQEVISFANVAQAISINTGTPSTEQAQSMRLVAQHANQQRIPWVLDPVGYSAILPWRSQLVDDLCVSKPNVIRANAGEILALAGEHQLNRGMDSVAQSQQAIDAAIGLLIFAEVVAISGESDFLISKNNDRVFYIELKGGSQYQPKITGMGCALGALVACYVAVKQELATIDAVVAAHAHFAVAAAKSEQNSHGLGQFYAQFIDQLAAVTAAEIAQVTLDLHDQLHD